MSFLFLKKYEVINEDGRDGANIAFGGEKHLASKNVTVKPSGVRQHADAIVPS